MLRLPAEAAALASARRYVSDAILACGLDADEHYQFVYAVNEALTNAIKHGAPDGLGMISVSVDCDSHLLTVTVGDPGDSRAAARAGAAEPTGGSGGRGLGLMLAMTDAMEMHSDQTGTTVSLSKRLPTQISTVPGQNQLAAS
jgi:anti-sigma regulatory factor (Ser/Thr protein kinase)